MGHSFHNTEELYEHVVGLGYNFFTGVPDSLLKNFQGKMLEGPHKNIIAAHESHAVAIAFGAELAGMKSCVYIQNSGVGNLINPLTSLCIPSNVRPLIVIGHRHSLPQHKIMGETDVHLLELIGYDNYIIAQGDNNVK